MNALFLLQRPDDFVDFSRDLERLGWSIHGSGSTVHLLRAHDVPVVDHPDIFTGPPAQLIFAPWLISALTTSIEVGDDGAGHPRRFDLVCCDLPLVDHVLHMTDRATAIRRTLNSVALINMGTTSVRLVVWTPGVARRVADQLRGQEDTPEFRLEICLDALVAVGKFSTEILEATTAMTWTAG